MRSVKVFISVVLIIAFALATASCGMAKDSKKNTKSQKSGAEESAFIEKLENAGEFYVFVGREYDKKVIRLRRFNSIEDSEAAWCTIQRSTENEDLILKYKGASDVEVTWWEHDPDDYNYGDIFIANGIEPEIREVPYYDGTVHDLFFGTGVKLEKLGNCRDLMTLKVLEIEAAEYDGYGHWSVLLNDLAGENDYGYYYGFRNDAVFGVEISESDSGSLCLFAFVGDIPIIPVEM